MSYKTILVHLNDMRRAEAMLEPAVELATRYNSHLKGLHVDTITAAPPLAFRPAVCDTTGIKRGQLSCTTFSASSSAAAAAPACTR